MKASVIPSADILKYMNQARTDPVGFSKYVQKELDSFINDHEMPLFKNCNYITNEGKKAWMEAVAFLQKHPPMTAFKINAGLSKAAEDHGYDMMQHNFFGHTSSNGTSFDKRIDFRCGPAYGAKGECLGSDFDVKDRNHALQTVMGLIIDDGVPSRGHRKNIFSDSYKYVGIFSGRQNDKIFTVIDFHSEDLPLVNNGPVGNGGQIPSQTFNNISKQPVVTKQQIGGQKQGGKYEVSSSTSTKTEASNGVTKTTKKTVKHYSDGSTEETVEVSEKKG